MVPLRSSLLPLVASMLFSSAAAGLEIELVNRSSHTAAVDSDGPTERLAGITPDGRYTLFLSHASNLTADDTNRIADLFVHDGNTGANERVSVGDFAAQAVGGTIGAVAGISDDGRFVVFDSDATIVGSVVSPGARQVYLRDRVANLTTALSRHPGGNLGTADSANPQISADGRYVVFDSAEAFASEDTNGLRDVYRLDRQSGAIELMSTTADGRIGNGDSYEAQISADGNSVAFYTWSTNLVGGDTNSAWELLLRKPAAGTLERVSVRSDGGAAQSFVYLAPTGALSADGRFVLMNAYEPLDPADTNSSPDGYLFDSQDRSVRRVTLGIADEQISGFSSAGGLSRDGLRIVFQSSGPNVVAGQNVGNFRLFVRDLPTGTNTHVTFRTGGEIEGDFLYAGAMSSDGSIVVGLTTNGNFVADDNNLMMDLIRQDGRTSAAQRVSAPLTGSVTAGANHDSGFAFQGFSASADGRFVAFASLANNLVPGDLNGANDVFVRDRLLQTTERVSVYSNGSEGFCGSLGPDISDDGRYVVFHSCTPFDLSIPFLRTDIYRHDRLTHTTTLVSRTPANQPADSFSTLPSLSADGRFVAFGSCATDLVPGDANARCDIFVRDMDTGTTLLATPSIAAGGADHSTNRAWLSRNGRYAFYTSEATNLVANDTNAAFDVFRFDRTTQTVELVSRNAQGEQADDSSDFGGASHDGSQVLFLSFAGNLSAGGPMAAHYVRDIGADTTRLVSRTSAGERLNGVAGPAAISADGRRVAFTTPATNSTLGDGMKLALFDQDRGRLSLIRRLDERFGLADDLLLLDAGSKLLTSSGDNALSTFDDNNHFVDVFLFHDIHDYLFANGFESP